MSQQLFAGFRRCDAPGRPSEQSDADLLFQATNCVAERGLGHPHPFRGSSKAAFLRTAKKADNTLSSSRTICESYS